MDNILKRRSYRKFSDEPIEDNLIIDIIRAGMQAPSSFDQRPWHFLVIRNLKLLNTLATITPYSMCIKNSSVAIIPCYKIDEVKISDFVICDMSACVENMLIKITDLNLGGVWIGIAPNEENIKKVQKTLKLELNIIPFCIIPLGYPKVTKEYEDRFDRKRITFIN